MKKICRVENITYIIHTFNGFMDYCERLVYLFMNFQVFLSTNHTLKYENYT